MRLRPVTSLELNGGSCALEAGNVPPASADDVRGSASRNCERRSGRICRGRRRDDRRSSEPRYRRRPLSSTYGGGARPRRIAPLAFDLADICDAAFGIGEANRLVAADDYFFFATLRLVFLTVFFAADFVFAFAFFAILPS